jgi:hypothetical protein
MTTEEKKKFNHCYRWAVFLQNLPGLKEILEKLEMMIPLISEV